jgi:hypothetical protein
MRDDLIAFRRIANVGAMEDAPRIAEKLPV